MCRKLILFVLALACCGSPSELFAQYGYGRGYCAPTYRASYPSYYRSYYSAGYGYSAPYYSAPVTDWRWEQFGDTPYFLRVGNGFNDGWLYVRSGIPGEYVYGKHCKVAEFVAKQTAVNLEPSGHLALLGNTLYGYDKQKYEIAKLYGPAVAGRIVPQSSPSALDVAQLLPSLATNGPARTESASKTSVAAVQLLSEVVRAEQQAEKEAVEANRQIALIAANAQALERLLGHMKDLQSVSAGKAYSDSGAANVQVGDQQLAAVVSQKCYSCHGGDQGVAGGIDFRSQLTAEDWKRIRKSVVKGTMPKGGQPLADPEIDLFEAEYDRARKASG